MIWCLCPIASSLSNELGLYDGLSMSLVQIVRWGLPYSIGRLYFGDQEGLRELTIGIVIGGLLCVLPCIYEFRMSPRLQVQVYGAGGWEGCGWVVIARKYSSRPDWSSGCGCRRYR